MGGETKSKRVFMTRTHEAFINELLRTELKKEGEYWVYSDGWSDEVIAEGVRKKFGAPITAKHVAGYRGEIYGSLREKPNSVATIEARVEARLARMSAQLTEIRKEPFIGLEADGWGAVGHRFDAIETAFIELSKQVDELKTWARRRPKDPYKL